MKNIKFRTWNKIDKTMYTDAINNCKDSFEMILKYPQIYEVMQYTGLKDENKIEIYEGDIVKEDGWDTLFLVVFEDCKFIAKKIGHHNGDIFTKRDKNLSDMLFPIIVGNKFTNPNLSKEE